MQHGYVPKKILAMELLSLSLKIGPMLVSSLDTMIITEPSQLVTLFPRYMSHVRLLEKFGDCLKTIAMICSLALRKV